MSYTLNTIDRPAVLPFACNQRDEARLLGDKAVALQAQPGMKQQTFLVSDNAPFVSSPPQSKDAVVFEPGSCSRVGRLKVAEDGMVQTLEARMGTGGECSPRYVYDPRFWNIATPEQPMLTLLATSYKEPPVVIVEVHNDNV